MTVTYGRTRHMSIPDWCTTSANWREYQDWRYPISPTGSIVAFIDQKGRADQPNPDLRGQRITADENHGFFAQRTLYKGGEFRGDVGGNFFSQTRAVIANGYEQHSYWKGATYNNWIDDDYHGPFFASDPRTLSIPIETLRDLTPLGTTAIARCKPTNNVADLANDLSETFTTGLPKLVGHTLWRKGTKQAKNAGEEYLNMEFGWKPLVSDIRGASYAVANAHRLLEAYERNSGKVVRRSYVFPIEKTEVTVKVADFDGVHLAVNGNYLKDTSLPMPALYRTTRTYRKTWFSGGFTYFLPRGYNSRNWLARTATRVGPLLGVEATPDVVWNCTPWTWAVDWFSNMGDVVSNVSDWSHDGLAMKYGYIMEHCVSSKTLFLVGQNRFRPVGTIECVPVTAYVETKRRERATPFGFGLTWEGLTNRQKAIAISIGLTRR